MSESVEKFMIGPAATLHVSPQGEFPILPGLGVHAAYRLNNEVSLEAGAFHAQSVDSQTQAGNEFYSSSYRSVQQAHLSASIEMWKNKSLDLRILPLGIYGQREFMRLEETREVSRSFGPRSGLELEANDKDSSFAVMLGASMLAHQPTMPQFDLSASFRF